MRIKKFTLLTLALLLMSGVAFAQKNVPTDEAIAAKQSELRAMARAKAKFGAFDFNHKVLPQFTRKARSFNLPAEFKNVIQNGPTKFATQARLETKKEALPVKVSPTFKADKLLSPSWGQGSLAIRSFVKRAAPEGSLFYDDFETGSFSSSWTLKTLNQGSGWTVYNPAADNICNAHSGTYVASSWSWNSSAYNVDNWLIAPKVALGGSVVFWTYTNASYPDPYEVLLSTTGTETEDFTVTLRAMAADAGGKWVQQVLDLSAYAGQEGYIAIHHVAYDMNYLFIDDFAVTEDTYIPPTPVTPPAEMMTMQFTILAYDSDNEPFERVLTIGIDGTDVYVQGTSYYMKDAWIKGTLNQDGTVTFATGQYYGILTSSGRDYPMYFQAYDNTLQTSLDNLTLIINPLTGTVDWPSVEIMDCGTPTGLDELYQSYQVMQVAPGTAPDILTPPAGIEDNLVEYRMEGEAYNYDGSEYGEYSEPIFIGFDGDDVWVRGVNKDIPETWIKGTRNGNTVTFPTGQKVGIYYATLTQYYEFYFAGFDTNLSAQADVTMTLDNATGIYTMTSPDIAMINSAWLNIDPNLYFTTLQFVPVPDVAATPAQPTITEVALVDVTFPYLIVDIPTTDEDGNAILTEKLSYQYYYDINKVVSPLTLSTTQYMRLTADMTEIPYLFTDNYDVYNYMLYLNQDFSTWNKIGIQSIYRGGGEEKRSEIFWYTIVPYPHEVTFVAANDLSIENGQATVKVNGEKAKLDADGKLVVNETYTVTLSAATGYKFVSVTATGATVELDANAFVATFEMPADDVTVNYEIRETYNEIAFNPANELTIQDGQATVALNGEDVTGMVDESGTLYDVEQDATVTITAEPGFKLANVTASYIEKSSGGGESVELTVHDGTAGSPYVPLYGFYEDAYLKCEYVMPASELEAMNGSNIDAMKFYLKTSAADPWTGDYKVFMKEVSATTISEYSGLDDATVVYEGKLDGTGETMDVIFDTPYQYHGGNLLIGFYCINPGNYKSAEFWGETVEGACVQGYSYSGLNSIDPNQRNFLPKTTFTYSAGAPSTTIQVGEGTITDQAYLPTYNLYNYSRTQEIYTASEINATGTINSISYYCNSNGTSRNLDIYLIHTKKDKFDTQSDWIAVTNNDKVFSGSVNFANKQWTTIKLDKAFQYNGTDNLCVIVYDFTGDWGSSMKFSLDYAENQSIVAYDDNVAFDPTNPTPHNKDTYRSNKAQMLLEMSVIPSSDLNVDLDADGHTASFTVPNGNVTVNYELVRLGTPVEVAAGKYITYYTDKDIVIYDEDCELLTVTAVDETTVTATPIEVAAAETPLLIYNSSDEDKELWIVPTEEAIEELTPDEVEVAPEFKGTLEEKTFTAAEMSAAEHFICDGENFIWVRSAGTIAANKCWLELTNDEPLTARSIVIGSGETTGVKAVDHSPLTIDNYYDLQGRRVAQPAKGLYINNGKKVVVK